MAQPPPPKPLEIRAQAWDVLHRDPRHRLEYPSEHVVRWLSGLGYVGKALDIGCGYGRHVSLLFHRGFDTFCVDASEDAVAHILRCGRQPPGPHVQQASMTALPWPDALFDAALSFGTFYYGSKDEHRAAIAEMHRVLRPGGRALVCLRRHDDWRERFTHNGVFYYGDEPEDGMPMHFVTEYEVRTFYAAFTKLELNWTKTTRGQRCDSDWLISLTK